MHVEDIMYQDLFKLPVETTVLKAAQFMRDNEIGSILIEDDEDKIIGIVTDRDLVRKALATELNVRQTTVRDIMSAPLIMIESDASVLDAAQLLSEHKIKRLVVQKSGRIVGIISTAILGSHLPKLVGK